MRARVWIREHSLWSVRGVRDGGVRGRERKYRPTLAMQSGKASSVRARAAFLGLRAPRAPLLPTTLLVAVDQQLLSTCELKPDLREPLNCSRESPSQLSSSPRRNDPVRARLKNLKRSCGPSHHQLGCNTHTRPPSSPADRPRWSQRRGSAASTLLGAPAPSSLSSQRRRRRNAAAAASAHAAEDLLLLRPKSPAGAAPS